MKKLILAIALILGFFTSATSQTIITWEVLKDVTFEEVFSEEFQGYYKVPKFGKKIKLIEWKKSSN